MTRVAREDYVQRDLVGACMDLRIKTTRGLVKTSNEGAGPFQTESKLFLSNEARRKTVRDEGRNVSNNRFAVSALFSKKEANRRTMNAELFKKICPKAFYGK